MVTRAKETPRFVLPTRIRRKIASAGSLEVRLALADRIADLPGIQTVELNSEDLPFSVDVLLSPKTAPARKAGPALLLCNISREGVATYGLKNWDAHQVLSRGWGRLKRDHVLLYMPRDEAELEVCWAVLRRGYESLSNTSTGSRPVRSTWVGDLPRFSRTTLQ